MSDDRPNFTVVVPCSAQRGLSHIHPLGTTDPAQYKCGHAFELCRDRDGIHCQACDLFISAECLDMLKWTAGHRYSQKGQQLAEDNTRLLEENRDVLAENIVEHTEPKDLVVDWYQGSGTTILACERQERRCYGMEIDPAYCDVIVERWQRATGKKATRVPAKAKTPKAKAAA